MVKKLDSQLTEHHYAGDPEYNYLIKDYLGLIRMVLDEAGNVTENYWYSPYGEVIDATVTGQSPSELKFTGHEEENEGLPGFCYAGARYYNSGVGIWYSTDPAGQGFSPYAYCGNTPTMAVDPDGEAFQLIPFAISLYNYYTIAKTSYNIYKAYEDGGPGAAFSASVRGGIAYGAGEIAGGLAIPGNQPVGLLQRMGYGAASGGASGGIGLALYGRTGANIWRGTYQGAGWGAAISGTFETLNYLSSTGYSGQVDEKSIVEKEISDPEFIEKGMQAMRERGLGHRQYALIKTFDTKIVVDNSINSYGKYSAFGSFWNWVIGKRSPHIYINANKIFDASLYASEWRIYGGIDPNNYIAKTAQTIYHESVHLYGGWFKVDGVLRYFNSAQTKHWGTHTFYKDPSNPNSASQITMQWFTSHSW